MGTYKGLKKPYSRVKKNRKDLNTGDRHSMRDIGQAGDHCVNGKIAYLTRDGARTAAKRIKASGGKPPWPRPFKCDLCSNWHLGHPKIEKGGSDREFQRQRWNEKYG